LFIFIVILCLFVASSFTGATFSHFTGVNFASGQAVALATPALFVAAFFLSLRHELVVLRWAAKVTSVAMGFLNFAFLAALTCWPAMAASELWFPVDRARIAWILLCASGLAAAYGLINAARLRVTRYTVHFPNLPEAWRGCHVALVSDLHIGGIRGPRFARYVVARIKEFAPTAVFITGDMFDGAKVDIAQTVEPWSTVRAPAGTYFVTGNHDEMGDCASYLSALAAVGVRVLDNEKVTMGGLQIVGIHDSQSHRVGLFRGHLERAQIDRNQPSILLLHRPAHVEISASAGVSLQLSGHTHAGQFPLWTFLVRMAYGRFAYGLNRAGGLQVVTSSGAGTGGPPLRVGTRSEIVLLRLESGGA